MTPASLIVIAALIAQASPATAHRDTPSRPAEKGCAWQRLDDAALGLAAWVQHCDFGFRRIELFARGHALMIRYSDGGAPEPLIEVFDLAAGETPQAGMRRVFVAHTSDPALVAHCRLVPYRRTHARAGVVRYTFVPDPALERRLGAESRPDEVPEPPCGDWGESPDGIQYFEVQSASPRRFMFVRVGQDRPLFDEDTLQLLPTRRVHLDAPSPPSHRRTPSVADQSPASSRRGT